MNNPIAGPRTGKCAFERCAITLIISVGTIGRTPRTVTVGQVPRGTFGDAFELLRQRERVEAPVVVVEPHHHRLGHAHPHTDLELVDDVQLPGILETSPTALVELGGFVSSDRRRTGEHRGRVRLLGGDARQRRRHRCQRCAHLVALDDHVEEVRTDAATLEPDLAPAFHRQRVDLAEVRGTFDRRTCEAQLRGRLVVVDARVTGVLLLGQHLRRRPEWSGQRLALTVDVGVEAHRPDPARSGREPVRWRVGAP
jgi:hypothetical protein